MKKELVHEHIEKNMEPNDTLIGFFYAISPPKLALFFLIGPLAGLCMRIYFLAVTEKGLYFHKLNMIGKFKECDFFEFNEIEKVKIGKGFLQRPLNFYFKNKRKIKLKAQLKGSNKVALITPEIQSYIESKVTLVQ